MKTELVKLSGNDRVLVLAFGFTLSKLAYEEKSFNENDYEQLWLMCLHFLDSDGERLPKKLKTKKVYLLLLLRFLGTHKAFVSLNKADLNNLKFYCRNLFLSSHEYFGLKLGMFKTEHPEISFKILPKRSYKPVPYIGVGYKDKGSMNDPSTNGVTINDLVGARLSSRTLAFQKLITTLLLISLKFVNK